MKADMRKRIVIAVGVVIVVMAVGAAIFLKTAYVVPVLMYHSIDHDDQSSKLIVKPESFERQMAFLARHNYNVVGLDEIVGYITGRKPVPPRTVAITFDDGFYNNYEYAYPVLKRYGIPATIFVIADKIGEEGYLGWDELREMTDSGLITIGSHSMSHKWLPSLSADELAGDLHDSRAELERGLGMNVDLFCYPCGAHNEAVKEAVREAGYTCAVATNPGPEKPCDDIYAIKRVRISRTSNNLFVFWIESSGYYTFIKEIRDD